MRRIKVSGLVPKLGLSALFVMAITINQFLPLQAYGLSKAQAQLYSEGIDYFDIGAGDCSNGGETVLTGSDSDQQAYNYFIQKGLSAVQASAVVGNLIDESHLDPTVLQKGGDSKNPADAGTDPTNDGWGIAQWSPGAKVIDIAKGLNITTPIYELATQLDIVWAEMNGTAPTGYQSVTKGLKQITDLPSAVTFFQVNFEGGVAGTRLINAQGIYAKYGQGGGNSGTTVSTPDASGGCDGGTAINCSPSSSTPSSPDATSTTASTVRQNVVCLTQKELALWKSQPGYNNSYPGFPYARTGYLKYVEAKIPEEWCADFVSWIYNQAGAPVQTGGDWDISYVPDLPKVPQNNNNFTWHAENSSYTPQPGDIAVHILGDHHHTNIFISSSGGTSTYIGGDQGNPPYPGGSEVSIETGSGYYDNDIIGYLSSNN